MSIGLRIFFAIFLSSVTLGVTLFWYHVTEPLSDLQDQEVLAEVVYRNNEVNKKPKTRLVWKPLEVGDFIANGEAIRTQSDADIKLMFKDGTELQVEPDTFIIISKKENKIGLNLLEGALLASQGKESSNAYVLESESGDIDLSNTATSTISKIGNEKVQLSTPGSLTAQGSLFIKSPESGAKLFFRNDQLVTFELNTPEDLDLDSLKIKLGVSRKSLKEIQEFKIDSSNKLLLKIPAQSFYTQLTGVSKNDSQKSYESPVVRYQGIELMPPGIIFPRAGGEYKREAGYLTVIGQVSKSQVKSSFLVTGPKDYKRQGDLDTVGQAQIEIEPGGPYSLYVESQYGNGSTIRSEVVTFSILEDEKTEKPPFDLSLADFPLASESPLLPFALKLKWALSVRQDEVAWIRFEYQVKEKVEKTDFVEFSKGRYEVSLNQYGLHQVRVIAYDSQKNELASSKFYDFELSQTPFIGPVIHNYQSTQVADGQGNINISWLNLNESVSYKIKIYQMDSVIDEKLVKSNSVDLKALLPGNYVLKIVPIDRWNREGVASAPLTLNVPEVSSIRAPSGKKVKVR